MWNWIIIIGSQTVASFLAYNLGHRRGHIEGRQELISGHRIVLMLGISELCINAGCQEVDRES